MTIELEFVTCNQCGGDRTRPFHQLDGWHIVQCSQCGLLYLNPRPAPSELDELYSQKYFDDHFTQSDVQRQIKAHDSWMQNYERRLGRKGSLLDVGCGYGFLVAAAHRRGWQVKGIDISQDAVSFATAQIGPFFEQAIPQTWIPDRLYDVVVSSHSLEHVSDPREVLLKLKQAMDPAQSILHVRVPNFDSLDRRWHGNAWKGWDVPVHFHFFEPKTIKSLLNATGYNNVTVETQLFDPFLHLFVGLYSGGLRQDEPAHIQNAIRSKRGIIPKLFRGSSRVYGYMSKLTSFNRVAIGRDMEIWAKIQ